MKCRKILKISQEKFECSNFTLNYMLFIRKNFFLQKKIKRQSRRYAVVYLYINIETHNAFCRLVFILGVFFEQMEYWYSCAEEFSCWSWWRIKVNRVLITWSGSKDLNYVSLYIPQVTLHSISLWAGYLKFLWIHALFFYVFHWL